MHPRQRPSNLTVPPSLYELAETMLDDLNSPRHWRTRSMTSVAWKLEGESKGHFVWRLGPWDYQFTIQPQVCGSLLIVLL
jgi:hypothetical protein